ncbi:MAG: hypothetical protein ABIV51_13095, partial [Saprospiraceae bacterium]
MKKIFLPLLGLLWLCQGIAQNFQYKVNHAGAAQTFIAQDVSSDFGPRLLPGYDWHGGVDYSAATNNGDLGYSLISLEAGTLTYLHDIAGEGFKYLVIEGDQLFGYGHIFTSSTGQQTLGDFKIVKLKAPYSSLYAIYNAQTQQLFHTCRNANGELKPCEDFKYTMNGNDIMATNQILVGDEIAPMGTSYGSTITSTVEAHLHLYNLQSGVGISDVNTLNPLQFANHIEPDVLIKVFKNSDFTQQGIGLKYPGTTRTKIGARVQLTNQSGGGNYTTVMNINKVRLLISSGNEAFKILKGLNYESRIEYGGRTDASAHFPADLDITFSNVLNRKGSWGANDNSGINGISPRAYNSNPWDNFYFTDFISRIYKGHIPGHTASYADFPSDAKYNDGSYRIETRVTTVTNNEVADTNYFIIDNFLPFIQKAEIRFHSTSAPDGLVLSSSEWVGIDPSRTVAGNGTMVRTDNIFGSKCDNNIGNLVANCTLSEPMRSMWAKCIGCMLANDSILGTSSDNIHWAFNFGSITLSNIQYSIIINGLDFGANNIFCTRRQNSGNPFVVPTRKSDLQNNVGAWMPAPILYGIDSIYFNGGLCSSNLQEDISENRSGPCGCITADQISLIGQNKTEIKPAGIGFKLLTTTKIARTTWTYNGVEFSPIQFNFSNVAPGIYCVKVEDEFCCVVEKCVILKGCGGIYDQNLNGVLIQSHCSTPDTWTVSLDLTDPNDIISIDWSPTGIDNVTVNEFSSGNYIVSLVTKLGCLESTTFSLIPEVDPGSFISATTKTVCLGSSLGQITLSLPSYLTTANGWSWTWWEDGEEYQLEAYSDLLTAEISVSGVYTVIFISPAGCEYRKSFSINEIDVSAQVIDYHYVTTCTVNGSSLNGMIEIGITIPANVIGINWYYPDGTLFSGSASATKRSNLGPGEYRIVIKFIEGCEKEVKYTLCCCSQDNLPLYPYCNLPSIAIQGNVTPVNNGQSFGTITLTSPLDLTDLILSWTGPSGFSSDQPNLTNLASGTYTVTIASRCTTVTKSFEIILCSDNPTTITGDAEYTCDYFSIGEITVVPSSGNGGPYQYLWSNGQTSSHIGNLWAGNYCVTVTDKNQCKYSNCFEVPLQNYTRGNLCDINCRGSVIELDVAPEYDPNDCTFVRIKCEDGYDTGFSEFTDTYFEPGVDPNTCEWFEYCERIDEDPNQTPILKNTYTGTFEIISEEAGHNIELDCYYCYNAKKCQIDEHIYYSQKMSLLYITYEMGVCVDPTLTRWKFYCGNPNNDPDLEPFIVFCSNDDYNDIEYCNLEELLATQYKGLDPSQIEMDTTAGVEFVESINSGIVGQIKMISGLKSVAIIPSNRIIKSEEW